MCKITQLELLQLALEYIEVMDEVAGKLPRAEEFDLKSQARRAAVAVALNTAEATKSQSEAEQRHYLAVAQESLAETISCQLQIRQNRYLIEAGLLRKARRQSKILGIKLQQWQQALAPKQLLTAPEQVRDTGNSPPEAPAPAVIEAELERPDDWS